MPYRSDLRAHGKFTSGHLTRISVELHGGKPKTVQHITKAYPQCMRFVTVSGEIPVSLTTSY